jgi:hypothetical protein
VSCSSPFSLMKLIEFDVILEKELKGYKEREGGGGFEQN